MPVAVVPGNDFASQVRGWTRRRGSTLDRIAFEATLEVFNRALRPQRVDTGRMRYNFFVTQDVASTRVDYDSFDPRLGGNLRAEEANKIIPGQDNVLSNNLNYALVWEEREGNVARAVASWPVVVEMTTRKYNQARDSRGRFVRSAS